MGGAAALRAARDPEFARTDVRIATGLEQACHRCRWAAATGLRAGAGLAYRRADAATREGGMTAAPLQAKRDAPS
jgi:hypothetical protein